MHKTTALCFDELAPSEHHFSLRARASAFLLLAILCLQPLSTVFAADEAIAGSPEVAPMGEVLSVPSESVTIDDGPSLSPPAPQEPKTEVAVADPVVLTAPVPSPTTDAVVDDGASSDVAEGTSSSTADSGLSATPAAEGAEASQGDVTDTATTTDVATTTDSAPPATPVAEMSTTTPEELPQEIQPATTTPEELTAPETPTTTPEVTVATNDQNRYQFGVNDCVAVEDGFFYCTTHTPLTVTGDDRFFSAQDADGDFEIFLEKEGSTTQITHNTIDDSAPLYDAESDRLVWHALVNDRYQIMVYDLGENAMTQLTNDSFNNMEPSVSGDAIVWQAWRENNWEIMLDEDGERSQLTQNTVYDINPQVHGEYISWQTFVDGTWHAEIYDRATGKVEVMENAEGGSVENPRFVLVYDSKSAEGDVRTMGYDLRTKQVITLGAVPAPIPADIPKPDHEKEERALVGATPTLKEESAQDTDVMGTTPVIDPPDPSFEGWASTTVAVPSVATSSDLVITAPATSTSDTLLGAHDEGTTTLDMRPSTTTIEGATTTLIPDVVILPLPPSVEIPVSAIE